jgi:hypothetical protein
VAAIFTPVATAVMVVGNTLSVSLNAAAADFEIGGKTAAAADAYAATGIFVKRAVAAPAALIVISGLLAETVD